MHLKGDVHLNCSKVLRSPRWSYLCHKWPRICSTCLKHFPSFPYSWLITGFV